MEINEVNEPITAVRISQYPDDNKPEFLLVGRSNVGKSSFINTVIGRKNFARISSKPGKTQTLNFYLVNKDFYLVDVPGYGYAKVSSKVQEKFGKMIEEYLKSRINLKHVFLIVDYRHKPTDDDVLMYEFLKYHNLPVTIVATKYDKVKKSQVKKQNELVASTLKIISTDELVNFSNITKYGKENILKIIESYL